MQSLGFAFAMLPVLRRLYPDRGTRAPLIREQMEYFNTQPYLASFILGAAARREQNRTLQLEPNDAAGIKTALAGPLGALGDSFFWGGVQPLAACLAAAFLLPDLWWAPIFFLAFYNVWHVGARVELLVLGFRTGGDVSMLMNIFDFPKAAKLFKTMTLAVIGCLVGLAPRWEPQFDLAGPIPDWTQAAAAMLITLLLAALLRRGGSPIKLMLALAAASLILVLLGVNP